MNSPFKLAAIVALAHCAAFAAGDQPAVDLWTAKDLSARAGALGAKMDAFKSANTPLGTRGNQTFLVAHREGNGQAEWHEKQADIIVIMEGSVTIVYGGTIVNGKPTAAGEIRGDSIADGKQARLGPGDIFRISPKTPHQMMVTGKLNYFVAKVDE
jgi:mannose-6-phosphate isomerase-like protein (cupin superfamily)